MPSPTQQAYIAAAATEIKEVIDGMPAFRDQVVTRLYGAGNPGGDRTKLRRHLAALDDPASPLYGLSEADKVAWRAELQAALDGQAAFVQYVRDTYFGT